MDMNNAAKPAGERSEPAWVVEKMPQVGCASRGLGYCITIPDASRAIGFIISFTHTPPVLNEINEMNETAKIDVSAGVESA